MQHHTQLCLRPLIGADRLVIEPARHRRLTQARHRRLKVRILTTETKSDTELMQYAPI